MIPHIDDIEDALAELEAAGRITPSVQSLLRGIQAEDLEPDSTADQLFLALDIVTVEARIPARPEDHRKSVAVVAQALLHELWLMAQGPSRPVGGGR